MSCRHIKRLYLRSSGNLRITVSGPVRESIVDGTPAQQQRVAEARSRLHASRSLVRSFNRYWHVVSYHPIAFATFSCIFEIIHQAECGPGRVHRQRPVQGHQAEGKFPYCRTATSYCIARAPSWRRSATTIASVAPQSCTPRRRCFLSMRCISIIAMAQNSSITREHCSCFILACSSRSKT